MYCNSFFSIFSPKKKDAYGNNVYSNGYMMDVYGRGFEEMPDMDYAAKAYQRDLFDIQTIRSMENAQQNDWILIVMLYLPFF